MTEPSFNPDHAGADVRQSPNVNERRDGKSADILLLHYTGMETGEAAENWLCAEESQVSCHYVVHEDGRVVQLVPESLRAWHAGRSYWKGETDINSRSIGIEIVNPGHTGNLPAYAPDQIAAVIDLSRSILERHAIAPECVLGHSDVAPGRKLDPGEHFPWSQLHDAGIGHLVPPAPIAGGRFFGSGDQGQPVEALQSMLALYGYHTPVDGLFGHETCIAVEAFQRHFRQERVDGIADMSTVQTLHALLSALPKLS